MKVKKQKYVAFAQLTYKDGREEAIGIEKAPMPRDFDQIGWSLLNMDQVESVKVMDDALNLIGIYSDQLYNKHYA